MIKLGINGYGRIGRNILKAFYENKKNYPDLKIVAINDLGNTKINAHLTRYDTVHGKFNATVQQEENALIINNDLIRTFKHRNPINIPWKELDIDIVLECTGVFTDGDDCRYHLEAGAKKVLISAPAKNIDATIVYGVNHHILNSNMQIISNASCTTNCLAPIAQILHNKIGIENGLMTTIHSYTNDQVISDVFHQDIYRTRAAGMNMIPTKTGAAEAVGLVIPELKGKFSGMAVRVPTINVSLIDLSFTAKKSTSVNHINDILTEACQNATIKKILHINHEPLVSSDFNHWNFSSIFDATQTKVMGNLVKIMSWYDNEWGFSNRMLDTANQLGQL